MNFANQAAGLASLGRGEDSMLVHMTPAEVGSLQQIAANNGGSLTVNPETGLPEAGFLGDILPAIAGVGLSMMRVPPIWAGLGIGALTGLITQDFGKGISAGFGAYGGAGLGEMAGIQNAVTKVAPVSSTATVGQAAKALGTSPTGGIIGAGQAVSAATKAPIVSGAATNILPKQGLSNIFSKQGAKYGLAAIAPSFASSMNQQPEFARPEDDDMTKRYPYKGPYTFMGGEPEFPEDPRTLDREFNYFPNTIYPQKYYAEGGAVDSREQMYFQPSYFNTAPTAPAGNAGLASIQNAIRSPGGLYGLINPAFNAQAQANQARWGQIQQYLRPAGPTGWAYGEIKAANEKLLEAERQQADAAKKTAMAAAVNPAAAAFTPGRGYSDQGEQSYFPPQYFRFAEGGNVDGMENGRYLKGPGDGMSDDIPATIHHEDGNQQPARLAAGEFVIPADVVSHLGNGDSDSGAQKLYAMMDRIRRARTGKTEQAPEVDSDKFLPA